MTVSDNTTARYNLPNRLGFVVEGSEGDLYDVVFERRDTFLTASCTCPAGGKGIPCKHRFALMDGDVTRLVSDNAEAVGFLPQMMRGTDVETALAALRGAQAAFYAAKKELASRKKALGRVLNDDGLR